jgi:NAD(P)-dependent dehydrogenase (short-subunit alcohol dehydrogenase family)
MPKSISEQVIVVVGASSGIGLATARGAAARGARVVLAARNGRDLARAVDEIRRAGGEAIAVPTDVTDPAQVEALGRRAIAAYGRVDTWAHVAGVTAYAEFLEQSPEDFARVMDVVFYGQVNGARVALPLLEQTGGAFVSVGSGFSDRGVPLQSAYCAAKHALKGWIDSLRVELAHRRSPVRLTLIKPASMNTPLFAKARTQTGRLPQPIPPVYDPELAADAILRAAEGDVRERHVGSAGRLLSLADRVTPALLDASLRVVGYAQQQTDQPKAADAPSNLHAPMEHDGGVRGAYTEHVRPRRLYRELAQHPIAAPIAGAAVLGLAAVVARWAGDRRPPG